MRSPRIPSSRRPIAISASRPASALQAGAIPNPELSAELDDAFGTGEYRGPAQRRDDAAAQPGDRAGRQARGAHRRRCGRDWRARAGSARRLRLEMLSDTAVAFFDVLARNAASRFTTPRSRPSTACAAAAATCRCRRIVARGGRAGAARRRSRARRARTRAHHARHRAARARDPDGAHAVDFASRRRRTRDDRSARRRFERCCAGSTRNPQLIRWTAVRAQRDAELLGARLKPIPDVKLEVGWRAYPRNQRAGRAPTMRSSSARPLPIPVWDQNLGGITEAQAARAKVEAERAAAKAALILTLAKAYDTLAARARDRTAARFGTPECRRALKAPRAVTPGPLHAARSARRAEHRRPGRAARAGGAHRVSTPAVATIEGLTGAPLRLHR